jgi:hypothetical protein
LLNAINNALGDQPACLVIQQAIVAQGDRHVLADHAQQDAINNDLAELLEQVEGEAGFAGAIGMQKASERLQASQ